MVEVEILRTFWHDGRPAQAGQVVALDGQTAAYLVGLGRAAYVAERPQEAPQQQAPRPRRGRKAH